MFPNTNKYGPKRSCAAHLSRSNSILSCRVAAQLKRRTDKKSWNTGILPHPKNKDLLTVQLVIIQWQQNNWDQMCSGSLVHTGLDQNSKQWWYEVHLVGSCSLTGTRCAVVHWTCLYHIASSVQLVSTSTCTLVVRLNIIHVYVYIQSQLHSTRQRTPQSAYLLCTDHVKLWMVSLQSHYTVVKSFGIV